MVPAPRWSLVWLPLDAKHKLFTFVVEHSLGFGISMASNVARRFAYGLMYIFLRAFDDVEAPLLAADSRNPTRRAWIKARRALSTRTGRNECRLASALRYTDDPALVVVGVERTVRLLRVWRWLTSRSGLIMAIAAKHAIGTRASWLGFTHLPNLGALIVPIDKMMRTLVTLRTVVSGVALTVREYESLVGLLEHILGWANGQRSAMSGLHAPLTRASAYRPSTPVNLKQNAIRSFEGWIDRLKGRSGVAASAVFARSAFLRSAPAGLEATVYTDAAETARHAQDSAATAKVCAFMSAAPKRACSECSRYLSQCSNLSALSSLSSCSPNISQPRQTPWPSAATR